MSTISRVWKWLIGVIGTIILGVIGSMIATAVFDWRLPPWLDFIKDGGLAIIEMCAYLASSVSVPRWWYAILLLWLLISVLWSMLSVWRRLRMLKYTDEDVKGVLAGWFGGLPDGDSYGVIYFDQLDRKLWIPSGSSKKFLVGVAGHYGFIPQHLGENTVKFKNA